MSYSGSNAHELTARLLAALDPQYDVVDMQAVNEIISVLEKIHITKELLETTRLGKHVNLLRRRAKDPMLARRAKLLVKRWRDLVIPGSASRQNTPAGPAVNRTSAERQVRPLTSPALSRVLSPAVPSPKSSSRPGWSGYDSDSQDVILVDDDPPDLPPLVPALPVPIPVPIPVTAAVSAARTPHHTAPLTPTRRPVSPPATSEVKLAKRDKKPKKKRGHSRAGSGSEAASADAAWSSRNGVTPPATAPATAPATSPAARLAAPPATPPTRRNGCRKPQLDTYSTLMNKMPPAGAKKVRTTMELLEEIQSRGAATSPVRSPSPAPSPEVLPVDSPEPHELVPHSSPLRNGGDSPLPIAIVDSPVPPSPYVEPVYPQCTCSEDLVDSACEANCMLSPTPRLVWALHQTYIPGVNGTRATPQPHPHAVRPATLPDAPGLFASVVPLYRYLDYADDYCSKNLSHVDLCPSVPPDVFAPSPPALPPPSSPPPIRPYPIEDVTIKLEPTDDDSARLKPEPDSDSEVTSEVTRLGSVIETSDSLNGNKMEVEADAPSEENEMDVDSEETNIDSEINLGTDSPETEEKPTVKVEKVDLDGRTLFRYCEEACAVAKLSYSELFSAPTVPLSEMDALEDAFLKVESATERDDLGRPVRTADFAEWHEPARLTAELVALPYVVID